MAYDPVEQQIMDAFRALAPYGYRNFRRNNEWTLGITGIIGAIGWRNACSVGFKLNQDKQNLLIDILMEIQKNLNYTLYDPEKDRFVCPQYFGEFLYDVVWLKYEIDYNKKHLYSADEFTNHYDRFKLIDSPLVCESEWGDFGEIKEDFEKLLLTRSKYRIMVFSIIDQNQFNQYITRLTELILQYQSRQSGDRYLFCGTDEKARAFRFAQFIVP